MAATPHRAAPPRPPAPSRTLNRARQAAEAYRSNRAKLERSSITRGILIVAAAILLFSIARAGLDRTFVPNGWRW